MAIEQAERLLIKKALEGDERSFESLILSCKNKAYNIAYRYMKNEDDAMDALQESFIKVFRHLGKFNCESKFDTWVYRIVVNTCNDMLRKRKENSNSIGLTRGEGDEEYEIDIADNSKGPEELLIQKEESGFILECMDKLANDHKEILILRDIKGFSYEEISQILDCSQGTVKSRISRARVNLKQIYLKGVARLEN